MPAVAASEPVDEGASLPDQALRSALEFAVGIAAVGAKLRPPLSFPAGLRPFLRFHKLPPAALATVRAVIDGDPEFLHTLGSVATKELLDDVAMLWLVRPDGWEQQAIGLVAAQHPATLDDAGELRRELRRRVAAEAAALRARLELQALREQLESERVARETAQTAADRSVAEVAALRTQLEHTERGASKRSAGVVAESARAAAIASELSVVRAELSAAVAARDAALADRAAPHAEGPVDIERLRVLLTEALGLTRGSTVEARRRRRKPIALPGGVYGNSEAAGEHLLRTVDAVVLVDGYNVAKLGWPGLSLERQRTVCTEAAENMARRWGTLIHIVFDGAAVVGATASRRMVRVSFSPEGVTADDVLRAELAAIDTSRPVVVVTNDQAIVADVRAAGANVVTSDTFLVLARR